MPRVRNRTHRTSQSELLELSKDETIITETTTTTTTTTVVLQAPVTAGASSSTDQNMYLPEKGFLSVLKEVGAEGTGTSKGELFTFKQLGTYMKDYIKTRELYDVKNPAIVHCKDDPLGQVFGVPSFTFYEANALLRKHVQRVDSSEVVALTQQDLDTAEKPKPEDTEQNDAVTSTVVESSARRSPAAEVQPSGTTTAATPELSIPTVLAEVSEPLGVATPASRHGVKRKRQHRESGSSDGKGEDKPSRRRSPSFVIVDEWTPLGSALGDYWHCVIPRIPSADEISERFSVQSKETVIVESSLDDAWESDDERVQVVYSLNSPYTIDPPFDVEYDVESEKSGDVDHDEGEEEDEEGDSETEIVGELLVVCNESDVEWWADSESSDSESDFSTDTELDNADKWTCKNCGALNPPIRSSCDGCMGIRPGWYLTSQTSQPKRREYHTLTSTDLLSSGEDETDGPTLPLSEQNIQTIMSTDPMNPVSQETQGDGAPNIESRERSDPQQETGNDSGVDNWMSSQHNDSTMTLPSCLGSTDSGINMDITGLARSSSDCSTPLMQSTPEAAASSSGTPFSKLARSQTDPFPTKTQSQTDNTFRLPKAHSMSSVSHQTKDLTAVCQVCFNKPKDASIVHGNTGHQVCCYRCAKKLRRRGKPCPYCRKKIQKVIRNFIV